MKKDLNIVVLDEFATTQGKLSLKGLEEFGTCTYYDRTPKELVVERAKDADVIVANKIIFTKEVFDALPKLKYIGLLSTGFNVVDIEQANAHNVTVCNVPAYSTMSVSQTAIALMLNIAMGVNVHSQAIKEGKWQTARDYCFIYTDLIELDGKTLGIIGYGDIGKATAKTAKALGMNVIAYSRHKKPDDGIADQVDSLSEIYSRSDFISLHCALNGDSNKMIDEKAICNMKDGVVIINTARGGLIDEDALYQGLKSGKIYAFGGDVLTIEPPSKGNKLIDLPNTVFTPHIAWATEEARKRLITVVVENLKAFLNGKTQNSVN